MPTFKDRLRFYNNLDFEPFLEAMESIRDSYMGTEYFLRCGTSARSVDEISPAWYA